MSTFLSDKFILLLKGLLRWLNETFAVGIAGTLNVKRDVTSDLSTRENVSEFISANISV